MATTKTATSKGMTEKEIAKKEEVKVPAKKVTKTAAKKEPAKKAPAKKAPAKRTTTPKIATEVFVQFAGHEVSEKSLIERVKEAWVAEGNKATALKSVSLYVKPEECKAYYVVNGSAAGALDI